MNNSFLLFFCPKYWSQVWTLIIRNCESRGTSLYAPVLSFRGFLARFSNAAPACDKIFSFMKWFLFIKIIRFLVTPQISAREANSFFKNNCPKPGSCQSFAKEETITKLNTHELGLPVPQFCCRSPSEYQSSIAWWKRANMGPLQWGYLCDSLGTIRIFS